MERLAIVGIDVLAHVPDAPDRGARIAVAGYEPRIGTLRLVCFRVRGVACAACGLTGRFFALESCAGEPPHLNLYAVNERGEEIVMTHDHVLARADGGRDHLSNVQTMCGPCNWAKGSVKERANGASRSAPRSGSG